MDIDAFTAAFDDDIRQGHLFGTNGPILDVSITNPAGEVSRTGLDPQHPVSVTAASTLNVKVTAAPWIPVTEIRVYVNGRLAAQQDVSADFDRTKIDPFGTRPATTPIRKFPLLPLLADAGLSASSVDAWLVVEAGLHLDDKLETDQDGLPILGPNQPPARPTATTDPRFDIDAIAPGVWPTAFSNPFLLDVNGDHQWSAPGLPAKATP